MMRHLSITLCALLACACATSTMKTDDGLVIKERVNPMYPKQARDHAIIGCTSVSFVVRPDGTADQYQVVDSQPKGVFDSTTLVAINQWRFEPAPGRHVETINYALPGVDDPAPKCNAAGKR